MVDMSELQEFVFYQNFAFSQINHEVVFDAGRNPCYLLVLWLLHICAISQWKRISCLL